MVKEGKIAGRAVLISGPPRYVHIIFFTGKLLTGAALEKQLLQWECPSP
jgi:DNA helicase TIP49 (TBP-interacting protein)